MQSISLTSAVQLRLGLVGANRPRRPLRVGRPLHIVSVFGKGGGDKEDAARKALQDAFAGKKDPFQLAEERNRKRSGGGGDGGSGGGGKGGGSGGGGVDWSEWGDNFKRGASNFFKTVATVLLFAAALGALALWKPLLSLLSTLVRMTLRLDRNNPRAQLAQQQSAPQVDLSTKDTLSNVEEAVISKYATDEDE